MSMFEPFGPFRPFFVFQIVFESFLKKIGKADVLR